MELREYLENIYFTREHLEEEYNTHKKSSNAYTGHWSFEATAIVKLKGLDDASVKDCPYYPFDLVHPEQALKIDEPNYDAVLEAALPQAGQRRRKWKWWPF